MGASPVHQACEKQPTTGAHAEAVEAQKQKGKQKQVVRTLNRNSVRKRNGEDVYKAIGAQVNSSFGSPRGRPSPRSRRPPGCRRPQDAPVRQLSGSGQVLLSEVSSKHRIVVIGDLHGMAHKAEDLWRNLEINLGEQALLDALVVFLGDYVDRGPYTKDLVSWLLSIQRRRARMGARTVFLCGNHEFCLLGFLGMLPRPDIDPHFDFGETWGIERSVLRLEKDRLWGGHEEASVLHDVHIQGRRWAGSCYERSYGSNATFASYGVEMADREGLITSMPEEHLEFLASCPWVHIEESPLLGRLIFVHAGLESIDCEAQLSRLKQRDARHPQPEQLFGRDDVMYTPSELVRKGTTVISGHHGKVMLRTNRIILDSCCGYESNPLMALVLPEMLLVQHDGVVTRESPESVFGNHWRDVEARSTAEQARKEGSADGGARLLGKVACAAVSRSASKETCGGADGGKSSNAAGARRASKEGPKQPCPPKKPPAVEPKTQVPRQNSAPALSSTILTRSSVPLPRGDSRNVGLARMATDERFTLPSTLEGLNRTACQERERPPGDSSPLDSPRA